MENNNPKKTWKAGLINLSAFEKEVEGNKFVTYTLSKAYKKKDSDKWEFGQSFTKDDIPKIQTILQEAYKEEVMQ